MHKTPSVGIHALAWIMVASLLVAVPMWAEPLPNPLPACSAEETADPDAADIDPCNSLVDVYTTVGGFTEIVFGGGGLPEIPADFFFSGSQPFAGTVSLSGSALSATELGDTSMMRAGDPQFPGGGFPSFAPPVQVTVTGLALSSLGSINVIAEDGTSEEWLVAVGLSAEAQSSGSFDARLDTPDGGAFSGNLPVLPVVGFVRLADIEGNLAGDVDADEIAVRFLDFAEHGLPPIDLQVFEVPFSTVPPPDSPCADQVFYPGYLPGGGESVIITTQEEEPVRHVFEPPPKKKNCAYRHASSTASSPPAKVCLPACPQGMAPFKTPDQCLTVADCPPFKSKTVKCTRQGHCLEVYTVFGCV